jgi:hypothetical protein
VTVGESRRLPTGRKRCPITNCPWTARAGLTEDVIPVGDTVTASGHRHNDPATLEIKTERLTWNGIVFNVYPDRE